MKYFTNCKTAEELKKEYRKLAMELHPDIVGGDGEEFKRMQNDFETMWQRLKNVHQNAKGETYTKETKETPAEFMNIINTIINFKGCKVEICGAWIWISGNTKDYKDVLKNFGFKWAYKKSAWYYHKDKFRKRSRKELSLDEIREMYGSKKYNQVEPEKLPA